MILIARAERFFHDQGMVRKRGGMVYDAAAVLWSAVLSGPLAVAHQRLDYAGGGDAVDIQLG